MFNPHCVKCGFEYNPKRAALGYRTCMDCNSSPFRPPVIPMSKSNYIVGTMQDLLESYGAKGSKI